MSRVHISEDTQVASREEEEKASNRDSIEHGQEAGVPNSSKEIKEIKVINMVGKLGKSLMFSMIFFFFVGASAQHERDEIYARFAHEVEQYTVGLYLSETRFTDFFFVCTATLVKATETHIYGFSAKHCFEVEDDEGRSIRIRLHVAGHTGLGRKIKGQEAEIILERPFNEFVVFKIRNNLGVTGDFVRIAYDWDRGDRIYLTGYLWWDGPNGTTERVFMPTTGTILSARSDPPILNFGDIIHTASVFYGYSGGGNYVYDYKCQCFELIGVTVGLIKLSLWSVSQSVLEDWQQYLEHSRTDTASEGSKLCRGAESWPDAAQDLLKRAISEGWEYELSFEGRWLVTTRELLFEIAPILTVAMDVLNDRIPLRGKMSDVEWERYECAYVEEDTR